MSQPIDDELLNAIVLGGVRSPGKVTLSGHDRVVGWDVKKGAGQAGATTTRTSEDPAKVKCSFYLVTDDAIEVDDIGAWPTFDRLIRSTVAGPTPKPLDVYHPDLAANDIKSVVLETFGGVTHDGKGGQTIVVTLLEYRPPKPKGGTPKGAATKKAKVTDPNAEANAELARLTAEYKKTPWS